MSQSKIVCSNCGTSYPMESRSHVLFECICKACEMAHMQWLKKECPFLYELAVFDK
jgi:hypothetical protein